jgi:hypothetical protein
MQQSLNAMTIALRVLTALTEHQQPDPNDVDELRRLTPLSADADLDELACDVIHRALKHRTEIREETASAY